MILNKRLSIEEQWKRSKYEGYLFRLQSNIEYHKREAMEMQKYLDECKEEFEFYKKYGHSKNGFTLLDFKYRLENKHDV